MFFQQALLERWISDFRSFKLELTSTVLENDDLKTIPHGNSINISFISRRQLYL